MYRTHHSRLTSHALKLQQPFRWIQHDSPRLPVDADDDRIDERHERLATILARHDEEHGAGRLLETRGRTEPASRTVDALPAGDLVRVEEALRWRGRFP